MVASQTSQEGNTFTTYPDPLIIPPLQNHKQTFIILHGRGSNASTFGPPLLNTQVSKMHTFQSSFPNARFVFPTASKRRAQIFNRSVINQWFDNWSLQAPDERTELQIEGLRETSRYIHTLLRGAIEDVGAENVVLGGLSQGCAASLIALLTWNGEPIAAAFGMCGWLPFRMQMEEIAGFGSLDDGDGAENDLFESDGEAGVQDLPTQGTTFLFEELELSAKAPSMSFQQTPVFLGHGVEDEKVAVGLGQEAVSCLKHLGASVEWQKYEGLGHWYSGAMLCDLVDTLRRWTTWEQN